MRTQTNSASPAYFDFDRELELGCFDFGRTDFGRAAGLARFDPGRTDFGKRRFQRSQWLEGRSPW
ncbi:hypothetical protein BW247_01865 [Acidihalobacter ferrooxydans]|uniref:Uncharacterized protein n=1 Tax=Acidihalobacter ferrooxydans TaxID=1765967 RepID=A0A1P8UDZ2_9GAMM|nr:hypothetical protein BW247_01865 [Acidihalobacter ferrooxydans]